MGQGIEQRSAGRQLDAEIAERVLGATWVVGDAGVPDEEVLRFADNSWSLVWRYPTGRKQTVYKEMLPNYSTDIAAAFQVVEAMRAKCPGWDWQINVSSNGAAVRCCHLGETPWTLVNPRKATGMAALSLAICLAALKALDAEQSPTISAVDPLSHTPDGIDG